MKQGSLFETQTGQHGHTRYIPVSDPGVIQPGKTKRLKNHSEIILNMLEQGPITLSELRAISANHTARISDIRKYLQETGHPLTVRCHRGKDDYTTLYRLEK